MHNEADFSAEQSGAGAPSRFPGTHGDSGRPQRDPCAARARPQQVVGLTVLTRRADFLAANQGRRAPTRGFLLLVRDRGDGDPAMRIGYTVSKKVGNAVVRNRMKRRFRALAREVLATHGIAGADHVLIGRHSGIEHPYADLVADLKKALARARPGPPAA